MPVSNVSPKRILVRVPQWLGDAVVSTVFIRRLKRAHPGAHIVVACRPYLAPVFETLDAADQVLPLSKEIGVRGAARLIRAGGFDTAYVLPQSARTTLEPLLGGVPRRIGFGGDLRSLFFTETRRYDVRRLYPRRYLALIDDEGLDLASTPPHFPSAEPSAARQTEIFDGAPDRWSGPFLGLAPASIAPARTWDAGRFSDAVRRLHERHGGSVVLIGTAKERATIDDIGTRLRGAGIPVIDTAGRLSLSELGWIIRRCARFLANDSGLMHVASCFDVPTVIPFGSSDPDVILPPWGRFEGPYRQVIECQPCRRNHCARFGELKYACLKAVTVDDVVSAFDRLDAGR